jgi:uncharacterized protein YcbX
MPAPGISVAALVSTPIKGLRICARPALTLERGGARGDRRMFLVDERGRMVNGKHLGALNTVVADLDEEERRLTLTFPSGELVSGTVERGELLETRFFSHSRAARLVPGPFSAALSEHAGQPLRLVAAADGSSAIDRGDDGAVTLISRASVDLLAERAHEAVVDPRRFRMTIEVTGTGPHEEDGWLGRELAVGAARVLLHGHVGRCIVTSRHPDSGALDLPTLDLLREYRENAATTEPLAFGVYGSVLHDGVVRLGDRVALA